MSDILQAAIILVIPLLSINAALWMRAWREW